MLNTTVAFKGHFDARFPDLRKIGAHDDRIPGRPVAEMIARGLREQKLEISGVENEEPFFTITSRLGQHVYRLDLSIAGIGNSDSTWQINCRRIYGFWKRLFKNPNEPELALLLEAIEKVLKSDSRVTEIRWFAEPQYDPWSQKRFSSSPRTIND